MKKTTLFFKKPLVKVSLCLLVFVSSCMSKTTEHNPAPHLIRSGNITQLIVNGQPFLSLAGELHNSSSSNLEYMKNLWPILQQLNLNTVLAPVSWELVETVEGQFDFTLIDGLIAQARENKMKLVFLWFGSWKNLVSTYAPGWVKTDPNRFPLYYNDEGEKYQMLSAHSEESKQSDARAFAALMKHIRQIDSIEQTVIMMQVQNEVGTSFGDRDCSALATKAYKNQVPEKLMSYLQENKTSLIPELRNLWEENGSKMNGNWSEIFGDNKACNEIFMSWYLSGYIGEVIKAGKAEYDIPMFVNASVGRQTLKLATYPSGGPVPFTMDVWRAAAPELDILSPDIYYGDFDYICEQYTLSGNPLYIPEARGGESGAINAMKTFCNYNGLGFSPFGIERYQDNSPENDFFTQTYKVLDQLSHLILTKEAKKQMVAITVDTVQINHTAILGKYKIEFTHRGREKGCAMVIEINPDEFVVAGRNLSIEFSLNNSRKEDITGIQLAEEGFFENNQWVSTRRMNGDQIMVNYSFSNCYKEGKSGNGLRFDRSLTIQRVQLYHY